MLNVRTWQLHFTDTRSDKFYNVYLVSGGATNNVILHFGRRGSAGQVKEESFTLNTDAESVAMRQVYAKAAKGYKLLDDDFAFQVDPSKLRHLTPSDLVRAYTSAKQVAVVTGQAEKTLKLYDRFIERANSLIDSATEGGDITDSLEEFSNLLTSWDQIRDRHEHAAAAIGLAQQVVQSRLVGSP